MIKDPGPPPKGLRGFINWAKRFYEFSIGNQIQRAPGTLIRRGPRGVSITGLGDNGDGGGPTASLQFKGEFNPASHYTLGDIVICGDSTTSAGLGEMDDGREAGTFIGAYGEISPGDIHPGLKPGKAHATAVLSGGAIASITVDYGGVGYSSPPAVTITGTGTGATAHAVLTGNRVTSVVVDTGGSGYTGTPTIAFDSPLMVQKWSEFSPFPRQRFAMRGVPSDLVPATHIADKQRLIIDAGRQDVGGELPTIEIWKDITDASKGRIYLNLSALVGVLGTYPTADLQIQPRVWDICIDGSPQKAVFLSGAPFTP